MSTYPYSSRLYRIEESRMKKTALMLLLIISSVSTGFAAEPLVDVLLVRPFQILGVEIKLQVIVNQHLKFVLNNDEYITFRAPPGELMVSLRRDGYEYMRTESYLIEINNKKRNTFLLTGHFVIKRVDETDFSLDELNEVTDITELGSKNE